MKINKAQVTAMLGKSDDDLWREIRRVGGGYGVKIPEKTPPPAEMAKLRALLSDVDHLQIGDAMKWLNNQRKDL